MQPVRNHREKVELINFMFFIVLSEYAVDNDMDLVKNERLQFQMKNTLPYIAFDANDRYTICLTV